MTVLTRYMVPCVTEGFNIVSDYRLTIPTCCPNNSEHIIEADAIIPMHSTSVKITTINQQSHVTTGEFFRVDQNEIKFDDVDEKVKIFDVTYPYNISCYSVTLLPTEDNIGDTYEIVSYPDTPIGVLLDDLEPGVSSLTCANCSHLNPGFYLYVTNGKTKDNLGIITSIDPTTYTIKFTTPVTNSYSAGAAVLFTIPRLINGKIINSQNLHLGTGVLSTSGLSAGNVVRMIYTNVNGKAKTFNFIIELQF